MAKRKSNFATHGPVAQFLRTATFVPTEPVDLPPMEQKKGWLPEKFKGMLAEREKQPTGNPLEIRKGNVIRRPAVSRLFTNA